MKSTRAEKFGKAPFSISFEENQDLYIVLPQSYSYLSTLRMQIFSFISLGSLHSWMLCVSKSLNPVCIIVLLFFKTLDTGAVKVGLCIGSNNVNNVRLNNVRHSTRK